MRITAIQIMGALMAWMAGTAADAGEPQGKVTVDLRERGVVPQEVRNPAKALAGRMFAGIGITLDWAKRVPAGKSWEAPIIIELATETPEDRMPGALAYALPYEGTDITVFYDRIAKGAYPSTVLAHVMLHEITHLLQGIGRHSETGVMKARWTVRDMIGMGMTPLPFTREDVDLIYLGLGKRTAGAGVLVAER